jgi:hypothetical protein
MKTPPINPEAPLHAISLDIPTHSGVLDAPFIFQLLKIDLGYPTRGRPQYDSPILVSIEGTGRDIGSFNDLMFDISSYNIKVNVGDAFAAVFWSYEGEIQMNYVTSDWYAGGKAYMRENDSTYWGEMANLDFRFKTYVSEMPPPEPPSTEGKTQSGIPTTDLIIHGSNSINMEFVSIGLKENDVGFFGQGSVDYNYRIGKYEVTVDQWAAVLDADPRAGTLGPTTYTGSVPADTSWYEAGKFCNWLTTGDVYKGVYLFDTEGVFTGTDRSAALAQYDVVYALPTVDEWHKAAYYKPDGSGYTLYASGDSAPIKGVVGCPHLL